ncbi:MULTISPECIES: hypothetical protein [Oligella]|uniref:hypothetical protein n=1 Tax=Oligella TaxID=90243 RepID=UPI00066156E3|nr:MULTISPECIES: hypothetical protein [Oligella]OFV49704.1 hypothetical protein HMPREF3179_03595 [Oligella sp. HMSC09E12]
MAHYIDAQGASQQVKIEPSIYLEAKEANVSVETLINKRHPVQEGAPSAFRQMASSLGLYLKEDRELGIRPTLLQDVLDGSCMNVSANTRNDVPESRILFPATILSTIEDKLARDLNTAAAAFDRLVASTETIEGSEFKRVIINYDRPSEYRSQVVAQLARPTNMTTLTVSERSQSIPTTAQGIEWSDKFERAAGLDVIALSVARKVAVELDARANQNILALLNGDEDLGMEPLNTVQPYFTSSQFDAESKDGILTQKAWVKWLYQGRSYRSIDWVVTDIDGALAIENRLGKPTVQIDDGTSPRINSQAVIANPLIPAQVQVFVTENPDWPVGTIMGLDSRYAVKRINSLSADYSATAEDVIKRSKTMRWDTGSAAFRLFDEAFSVLELK